MSSVPSASRPRPTLRLFSAEQLAAADADRPPGLSPGMTLREFGQEYILPHLLPERRASPLTIGIYAKALDLWAKLTGDPPLCDIDDRTTSRFVVGLSALPGRHAENLSDATIHKHCRTIEACLALAGPKTAKRKKAQRLLEEVPSIEKPELAETDVLDNFELREIADILAACDRMRYPARSKTSIEPAEFWRSLVTVVYNTGERKGAIFQVKQPPAGATEIIFPGPIRKGKRKSIRVPLNESAREAIESIRTDRELLFPWPHCPRWFYYRWGQLLTFAGIPETRQFGLHGIRKATCTEMVGYSVIGAQLTMGHPDGTLLHKHYVNRRVHREALDRLPQPRRAATRPADSQRMLF